MATKNLIPRGDGEGGIGKPTVAWGSGVFKTGVFESALTISGVPVLTGQGFLTQDSDGNVGIGTTSPNSSLHVKSAGIGSVIMLESDDDGSAYAPDLVLFRNSETPAVNDNIGEIKFRGRNDNETSVDYTMIRSRIVNPANGAENGELTFWTNKNNTLEQRMAIDSTGNVGIGTTSPIEQLHLGSDTLSDKTAIRLENIGGHSLLGIARLNDQLIAGSTNADLVISNNESRNIILGTNNTERMRIDSDGNVGIGTTSPATNHKLHIKNTETANIRVERSKVGHTNSQNGYVQIAAAEGSNLIYSKDLDGNDKDFVIDAGNVGIGTAIPNAKLAIDGDLKIGEARINSENDRVVFDSVPAALDSIGNPQTFLTAEKLGLGTSENLATTSQDIEFKLLTDENRFVVGTTGEGGLASGWYRFNDFNVKGATDVGAISLNPVDTRIYSDEDSFVYMTRDAYGNRVAHLVGGDETPNPANNIALGLAIKIDGSDTPEDIEFTHTDGEQYSLVNGDSDSKGVNGLPIRQGFQTASIGAYAQPLLIDGGYF